MNPIVKVDHKSQSDDEGAHHCPCGELASRRCSACKTVWYCSKLCQKDMWISHIFDCKPGRPINTADHLALDVIRDSIPTDLQTRIDYGFEKAFAPHNQSYLLGLYIGLLTRLPVKVSPMKLHKHRLREKLIELIHTEFQQLPENMRGGYYPWFCKNQWILKRETEGADSGTGSRHPWVEHGWREVWLSIGGSPSMNFEEIRRKVDSWPKERRSAFLFYVLAKAGFHPSPESQTDLWISFGLCVFQESTEKGLFGLYKQLIDHCTFDEFCKAYDSSRMIEFIDSKGFRASRLRLPHVSDYEDVMRTSPRSNKSVWDLKAFVSGGPLIGSTFVDYGFMNCEGSDVDTNELKDVYRKILGEHDAEPRKLHEACIQGRLYEYTSTKVPRMNKKMKQLMKNPYPL